MSPISERFDGSTFLVRHLNPGVVRNPDLITQITSWLDEAETARLARLINPEHRHAFLVSHGLTRRLLSKVLGCNPSDICFGVTGRQKPVLSHPFNAKAVHFNLAHTQGLTVLAIGPEPMGIDTEWLNRTTKAGLAKRYFTQAEQRDIDYQPPELRQQRFLTYWTLKEAFLKAQAWGIADSLTGFEFELSPPGATLPERIRLRVRDARLTPTLPWRFHHWRIEPEHLISLAVSTQATTDPSIDICPWTDSDWI
ncbi:4'-phosphopantetheinyl transferase family protein [Orrella daihaiensis]|uniref:4'-phosphopantetheinyl transferase superfamily protein n=1 Tax=Orrella daihaiensis TaxID=2782176 RepID=A0ABY4ALD8_9BURK|nr:4'-phosphopantetheinyl transferase superfamily protein [Orrella daihaiensis]UOD51092.1 4'-phosphopantetheinyl transferase superfamily protein [Orrella daihaiensis]